MIEKMHKYSFVLLTQEKDAFIKELQELGLVDISRSSKPVDEHSAALLGECERLRAEIADIEAGSDAHLRELLEGIAQRRKEMEQIRPWGSWDREMLAATGLKPHFYKTDAKHFRQEWKEQYALAKISEEKDGIRFVIIGDNAGFPLQELPEPEMDLKEAERAVGLMEKEAEMYSAALEGRKAEVPALRKTLTSKREELSRYLASAEGVKAAEDKLTVFEGFAPVADAEKLKTALDKMPLVWFSEDANVSDAPPIKLRNRKFAGLFEKLTDMYGRPSYDGFDPTPFISIFFTLFFAFCMGDAGYGLVILLLGALLKGKLGKSTSALVMVLGAATLIIGTVFHSFFSLDMSKWGFVQTLGIDKIMLPSSKLAVPGLGEYDWAMMLALACGVLHICIAQLTKAAIATRNAGLVKSLGTWGWTILILGGVAIGVFSLLGVLEKSGVKIAIIAVGALSALLIFFLRDLKKNPLLNFGAGLWESYNTATGLLSDVLSYLRLYALGLAGSLLGSAFNDLAVMVRGDGGFGWVFFVLLLIVGHTLNIAMAGLGAFVHPLRLNFLEFFKNSNYEGSGRKFSPLAKENTNN